MQSSSAFSQVLDLFSSPLTLVHLLHPHTSPTLVHLSSHLPVPSSTVTPCVSLSSMSNCISIRPKGCLGILILSPVSLKSICTLPWPGQFHGLPCRKYQMTSLSSENKVSWGIELFERLIPPHNPSYSSSPPAQTSCSQV